jgi:hypothetical protein
VSVSSPSPSGGTSNIISLKIDSPKPLAGGTITHRALVGTDVSGASSLSVPDKTQQEFVATQAAFDTLFQNQSSKPTACTAAITANCFKDIVFLSPDRDRFFRQYYGGIRFKTYYFLDPNATPDRKEKCGAPSTVYPNDYCRNFPGIFDITWGQNESVTGGRLHGSILRFEGFYPIPSFPGVFVYGTTLVRLARRANIRPPLLLDLEPSPLSLSDPHVFPFTLDTTDRDFFRFGVAVDLIHLIHSRKPAGSQGGTGGAAAGSTPSSTQK